MKRLIAFFWGPSDPRSYALVRITLAVAALVNLVDLWPHRYEYLASSGMVPLDGLRQATTGKYYGSLFYAVSSEAGVTCTVGTPSCGAIPCSSSSRPPAAFGLSITAATPTRRTRLTSPRTASASCSGSSSPSTS
jgi:hypothetical protein